MKLAGNIVALRGKKLLIAACDAGQLPPLYTSVADDKNQPVGTIVDLYGSVARPYITILCSREIPAEISVGDCLYVIAESKPEKPVKFRHTTKTRTQPGSFIKRNKKYGN